MLGSEMNHFNVQCSGQKHTFTPGTLQALKKKRRRWPKPERLHFQDKKGTHLCPPLFGREEKFSFPLCQYYITGGGVKALYIQTGREDKKPHFTVTQVAEQDVALKTFGWSFVRKSWKCALAAMTERKYKKT